MSDGIKKMRREFHDRVGKIHQVEISIDIDAVFERMAKRVILDNKTGKATAMHGAIKARIVRD
jgi:hypothetical protein